MARDEGLSAPLTDSHESYHSLKGAFSTSSSALILVFIVLLAILVDYPETAYGANDVAVSQYYLW